MRHFAVITAISILTVSATAQGLNDSCAVAAYVTFGVATPGTNVGATSGPDPMALCGTMGNDVWYVFAPLCSGVVTATTCNTGTTFDTVIAAWDGTNGCGSSLVPLGCNDDSCLTSSLSSTYSFSVTSGAIYYVSVGGYNGAVGSFVFSLALGGGGVNLSFSTLGPATLGFTVTGEPAAQYLTVVSLNQGAYPNGWFFGIDVLPFELQLMLGWGWPVSGALDSCGSFSFGPVGGVPPGLSVYAVAFQFGSGSSVPTAFSTPATLIVP
jgi:hypothetical protein